MSTDGTAFSNRLRGLGRSLLSRRQEDPRHLAACFVRSPHNQRRARWRRLVWCLLVPLALASATMTILTRYYTL